MQKKTRTILTLKLGHQTIDFISIIYAALMFIKQAQGSLFGP
jgi:hypothetical protein